MRDSRAATLKVASTSMALIVAACSAAAPQISSTWVAPTTATLGATPEVSRATDSPRETTAPTTPEPTPFGSTSPRPSDPSVPPSPSAEPPSVVPLAELHGPFEPVTGLAATYCVNGRCQEAPPSPDDLPRAVAGLGGSGLSVELPPGTRVTSWKITASAIPSAGAPPDVVLGSGRAEPYAALYVAAPEKGDWVLRATIRSSGEDFVDHYWALRVREPSRPPMPDVGPPDGVLEGDRQMVTGLEGSFCFGDTCGDIGQSPTARLSPLLRVADTVSELAFHLRDGEAFSSWSVSYWVSRDDSASETVDLASGGQRGSTSTAASFAPPPPGDWEVKVSVDFPGGGDATYFIHLIVG